MFSFFEELDSFESNHAQRAPCLLSLKFKSTGEVFDKDVLKIRLQRITAFRDFDL